MNRYRRILAIIAVAVCCCKENEPVADDDGGTDSENTACEWDDNEDATAAVTISMEEATEGFLCPIGDQDWYSFTVPASNDLLSVQLSIDSPVTPVDLTYGVWNETADQVLAAPESAESATATESLSITHSVVAGPLHLLVRDRANDAQDVWHPYSVSVHGATDPDVHEPNNMQEDAVAYGSTPIQGYISYRGDEDWYRIDALAHQILNIDLTMPVGGIEPAYRVMDASDQMVVSGVNEAGKFEDTDIHFLKSIETAGTYYVIVSDDNVLDSDLETPYTLELSVIDDPDPNETNDHPNDATATSGLTSGTDWSDWITMTGYSASSGDVDWFDVPITYSSRSVVEVELDYGSVSTLPEGFQASVRIIRDSNVASAACETDQDCVTYPRSCNIDLDCHFVGNTCLTAGVCAGAGACMQSAHCGVDLFSEAAPETVPDPGDPSTDILNPNRNSVRFSFPTLGWGSVYSLYFAVADYQGDSYSLDNDYTLRVRVRRDPDLTEPNSAYPAGPPGNDPEAEAEVHAESAVDVPVHDCTTPTDGGVADCCDDGDWEEGYLSFKYDQDWYKYQHPCPDEDCMVRVLYELEAGSTDAYMQVYSEYTPWFDNLCDITDPGDQAAQTGYFGGIGTSDYCFYAYQGHTGDPFWYYLPIRDTIYVGEGQEDDGTWDWSTEQAYRFCIEKVADGCHEPPCQLYSAGCGAPATK